jgi:hypothetical protein
MSGAGRNEIRNLREHYRSGVSDLRRDFFEPCFRYCTGYKRAAGYFSSTALLSWLEGITRIAHGTALRLKLLVSNELSPEDADALRRCHDNVARQELLSLAADKVVEMVLAFEDSRDPTERTSLFAWLITHGHLELQFAFAVHVHEPGIFHEKIGVFDFPWGDRVAFTGSANETGMGHSRNYESIDVYRSWVKGDAGEGRHKDPSV